MIKNDGKKNTFARKIICWRSTFYSAVANFMSCDVDRARLRIILINICTANSAVGDLKFITITIFLHYLLFISNDGLAVTTTYACSK